MVVSKNEFKIKYLQKIIMYSRKKNWDVLKKKKKKKKKRKKKRNSLIFLRALLIRTMALYT